MNEFLTHHEIDRLVKPYADPLYRNLRWIGDSSVSEKLMESYMHSAKPFGLEIGFGEEPTKVYHVDPSIDWLLFESDPRKFGDAQNSIQSFWTDYQPEKYTDRLIIALNAGLPDELIEKSSSLMYRNVELKYMYHSVPKYIDLNTGQRMVFVVSGPHIEEIGSYREFLYLQGYNPDDLKVRDSSLPSLAHRFDSDKREYVLDITKQE